MSEEGWKKKVPMEFKLSDETIEQIEELALHFGIAKSHVVQIALDRLWNRKQEESPLE